MAEAAPFARLGIPAELRGIVEADTATRMAAAGGRLPASMEATLGLVYLLMGDPDPQVAEEARRHLQRIPLPLLLPALNERTHPKLLEALAELRQEPELDEKLAMMSLANDRTVRLIARRAGPSLCERLLLNHERLLMTPLVYVDLCQNPNSAERDRVSAENFLRMHRCLPTVPPPAGEPSPARAIELDLESEVMAAIQGELSPGLLAAQASDLRSFDVDRLNVDLGGFEFGFRDLSDELSWVLTEDREEQASDEEIRGMESLIRGMSPGQKIKLAYLGNREARSILLRDSNKMVAAAVVKSGRMSDGEGLAAANNRNLADEVIREVAANREWVRKYPFQVALVNNPQCPPGVAMSFIRSLNRNDLQALTRNRNIPAAISQAATRLYREKYKQG